MSTSGSSISKTILVAVVISALIGALVGGAIAYFLTVNKIADVQKASFDAMPEQKLLHIE